jgi:hypothetical protein
MWWFQHLPPVLGCDLAGANPGPKRPSGVAIMRIEREPSRNPALGIAGIVLIIVLALVVNARAQTALPITSFDITGFAAKSSVSGSGPLAGGSVTINGIDITIPANTVVQFPATDMGWGELFGNNPAGNTSQSGLGLSESRLSPGSFEFHVQGNIVNGQYIAGLVFIAQDLANQGQGFIEQIDYANGELLVNDGAGNVAHVQLNDPLGRFSKGLSPDARFTVDEDNPTVRAVTGYPMCLPRTDPTQPPGPGTGDDPLCPQINRPLDPTYASGYSQRFTTAPPGLGPTDPTRMAPFEVGDYITYSGVLFTNQSSGNEYISAYQIIDSVAIFTAAFTDPAYIAISVLRQGTGGSNTTNRPLEVTTRVVVDGFTTDPSRTVDIVALDTDCNGHITERPWATQLLTDPVVFSRFRFRPGGGLFLPPAREVHVYISSPVTGRAAHMTVANGLISGQYHAPNFTFDFPTFAILGGPPAIFNFDDFPWLVNGIGPRNNGTAVVGQLNPWPNATAPPTRCTYIPPGQQLPPPVAVASASVPVATVGQTVTLNSTGTTGSNITFKWSQTAGPQMTLSGATGPSASFLVPTTITAAANVVFTLTVTNASGSSQASVLVTLDPPAGPPPAPVAVASVAQSPAQSGSVVNLIGSNSSDPSGFPLTFSWIQTAGPAVTLSSPTAANPTFTAPKVVFPAKSVVLTFTLVVTNSAGRNASTSISVTVTNVPDVITIVSAIYQKSTSRFTVTASDNIVSPSLTISCTDDAINPSTGKPFTGTMGNLGAGSYFLRWVGGQPPTFISCKSNAGGSVTWRLIIVQ